MPNSSLQILHPEARTERDEHDADPPVLGDERAEPCLNAKREPGMDEPRDQRVVDDERALACERWPSARARRVDDDRAGSGTGVARECSEQRAPGQHVVEPRLVVAEHERAFLACTDAHAKRDAVAAQLTDRLPALADGLCAPYGSPACARQIAARRREERRHGISAEASGDATMALDLAHDSTEPLVEQAGKLLDPITTLLGQRFGKRSEPGDVGHERRGRKPSLAAGEQLDRQRASQQSDGARKVRREQLSHESDVAYAVRRIPDDERARADRRSRGSPTPPPPPR